MKIVSIVAISTVAQLFLTARAMEMDDMSGGDGDMDMDMPMMMMPMWFSSGNDIYWLFRELHSTTSGQFAGGMIVTFIIGVGIEALTYLRNYVYIRSQITAIRKTEQLNR